MEIESGMLTQV